jgi:small subunit ribosomal protein S20
MPHTSSAAKRLRQSKKRRIRNRATKKGLKLQLRELHDALADGAADKIKSELSLAFKRIDQAAAKRVIHANAAARKKSQLAKLVAAKAAPKPAAG